MIWCCFGVWMMWCLRCVGEVGCGVVVVRMIRCVCGCVVGGVVFCV